MISATENYKAFLKFPLVCYWVVRAIECLVIRH